MAKIDWYSPSDVFGLDGENWHIQSGGNPQTQESFTQALGKDGDQIASIGYDKKESVTCSYINDLAEGFLTIPKAGVMLNGYHVDKITVKYSQTAFPTMEVAGHKHLAGKPDENCRTYSSTVKLPALLKCVPTSLDKEGDSGGKVFLLAPEADAGMRSLSYSLSCTHTDEAGSCGEHLTGNNNDGVEDIDLEFTGNVAVEDIAITGWDVDSHSLNQSNTSVTTTNVSANHHIAHDIA